MTVQDPSYPIGKFHFDENSTPEKQAAWIQQIAETPARLREAVRALPESRLDSPYRPGGWTVRQLVHHVADSHANANIRFRLGLTEDAPVIRPYDQENWARLSDARTAPVKTSLDFLDALHERWTLLLRAMTPEDFQRVVTHAEWGRVTLDFVLQIYAWHGLHHVAHVTHAPRE